MPANRYPNIGKPSALLIKSLLERPLMWTPEESIIYRDLKELTYRELYERVQRLAQVLLRLGVKPGDRVGVMDWDSHRYLELFFAVPMIGAVLHTVNVRLSVEQTHYTLDHAEDKIVFAHTDFLPLVSQLAPRLPTLHQVVLLSDDGHRPPGSFALAGEYEQLLAEAPPHYDFPELDENTMATLFYTTGTTGHPKGVFFSHRQIVLHTLVIGMTLGTFREPMGISSQDAYLPLTPMFHVHAWGIPYLSTLLGLKQVYPGRYEPHMLAHLIRQHKPTFTHCVPTILQMLLHHPAYETLDFTGWKVLIGGSALPQGLARQARARGMQIAGGYGMSETCPVVAVAQLKPSMRQLDDEASLEVVSRTGFPIPLVRVGVVDGDGRVLPPGKENVGELVLQAPWLTTGYFKNEELSRALWQNDWLHTGDVAYLDRDGYVRITDRLKDVIKIGGEWISSLELENALSQHEAVKEVAVVGVADARWDERPHAQVVLKEEFRGKVSPRELGQFLHRFIDCGLIHKRAILTEIHFVDTIPRTSVGKLDKKSLRAMAASSARHAAPPA
jgi:fatty-acyl-CoA synthase